MVEDTPDDYIHDLFNQTIWGHEGLGQPILGRRETIAAFTREDLIHHISKYYGTKDIIISCAGKFQPAKLMELLRERFGGLRRGSEPEKGPTPEFKSDIKVYTKDISEAHICIGVPSVSQTSDDRYSLFVLNTLLGGGVSSRLFQEIRENRGLAYSVYSYTSMYIDTGLWGVYAGVSKKRIREVAELIIHEMLSLKDTLTEEELDKAKRHLKGNMILGLESTNSRMNNIARQEINFGRYISPDEISKAVELVSMKQLKELSERLLVKKSLSITAYGPIEKDVLNGIL